MSRLALLGGALVVFGACIEPTRLEGDWTALDRPASAVVWATTEQAARSLLVDFPEAMQRVEATMSLDRPDSELNRINREAADTYYRVTDRDLFRAVALAVDYAKASEGSYDPTLGAVLQLYAHGHLEPPGEAELESALENVDWKAVVLEREIFAVHFMRPGIQLDLDGLIEGYAIDVAARKFVRTGSLAGVLRLGNHVYAWGRPPRQDVWWLDVTDPRTGPARPLVRLRIDASRGIGVSGSGGASEPVFDPRSGTPAASGVVVAVAMADSVADAIAVSRALLVGGVSRAGVMLSERTRRVEAVLVVTDGGTTQALASASLQGRVEMSDALAAEIPDGLRFLLPPSDLKGRLD
jgi:thiamine biosynthesis lipoprotein